MSTISTPTAERAPLGLSAAACIGAVATVATWALATAVDDAFYLVTMVAGLATIGLAAAARRDARRRGSRARLAVAALVVGGVPAAFVVVYSIAYGISKLL